MSSPNPTPISTASAPAAVAALQRETPPPARSRVWPLWVAAFGSLFLTGLFQTVVFNRLKPILAEYTLTDMHFGILVAVITLLSSALGVTAAWLVPRWGIGRVCLLGFLVFITGITGIVWSPWNALAAVSGLVVAWGMAYLHLANGLAVQLEPRRGAQLTNLLHSTSALGKACGPTIAQLGASWRTPFLAVAGLAAVIGLTGIFGRAPAPGSEESDAAEGEPEEAPARQALRQRFFWTCALLFVPIVAMEQLVTVWIAKYVEEHAGIDAGTGAYLAWYVPTIILWTQLLGRLGASVILIRVAPIHLLLLSSLGAFGILVGTELNTWTGLWGTAGLLCCGLAFSVPYPTFFAIACRYFPRHKGLLAIVSGAATSLAFILFSALGGFLSYKADPRWPMRLSPLLGLCLFAGALYVHWQGERRLRQHAALKREPAAAPVPEPAAAKTSV